jgi:hypothetical protein
MPASPIPDQAVNGGMTISVTMVDEIIPPIIGTAIRCTAGRAESPDQPRRGCAALAC